MGLAGSRVDPFVVPGRHDVAVAVRLSIGAAKPGRATYYNIGSGSGSSMAQVVATAEATTGRTVPVNKLPPGPEPHTLIADNRLAKNCRQFGTKGSSVGRSCWRVRQSWS
jgi:UDP-glucose 4-epimerase